VIQAEGSFTIKRLESFHVSWDASIDDRYRDTMDKYTKGKFVAKRMRATMESILARHFGDEIVDVMFQKIFDQDRRVHGNSQWCIQQSCSFHG